MRSLVIDPNKRCPNCGSSSYRETITREVCPSCGLECDYCGDGPNDVYRDYMDQREAYEPVEVEEQKEYWEYW